MDGELGRLARGGGRSVKTVIRARKRDKRVREEIFLTQLIKGDTSKSGVNPGLICLESAF